MSESPDSLVTIEAPAPDEIAVVAVEHSDREPDQPKHPRSTAGPTSLVPEGVTIEADRR